MSQTPLEVVVLASIAAVAVTALAPLLGSDREERARWIAGLGAALAAGVMLAAGYLLLQEGLRDESLVAIPTFAAGAAILFWLQRAAGLRERDARPAGGSGMTGESRPILLHALHGAGESVAIAASMVVALPLGLYVTGSLALHNIAEGIALDRALRRRGTGAPARAVICVASRSPQGLLAIALFATFAGRGAGERTIEAALGFAAGSLTYLVLADLAPAADRRIGSTSAALVTASAAGIAIALRELVS